MINSGTARLLLEELTNIAKMFQSFPIKKETRRLMRDLPYIIAYDDGRKTLAQVASEFGCTKQMVSVILRRNGIGRETMADQARAKFLQEYASMCPDYAKMERAS